MMTNYHATSCDCIGCTRDYERAQEAATRLEAIAEAVAFLLRKGCSAHAPEHRSDWCEPCQFITRIEGGR